MTTTSQPTVRRSGISIDNFDPDVRPQDDLFGHVNGGWLKRTEIPADRARYGSFVLLSEAAEAHVRTIIEESTGSELGTPARKVGDLYSSFCDEARLDDVCRPERYVERLAPVFERLAALR